MTINSKLFEYGLEAAKVGRTLIEPELAPTPQRALTGAAHRWPTEALPFANAAACVDIVLLRSQEASTAYYETIKALALPGCKALISDTNKVVKAYAPNLEQFMHKATTMAQKSQFTPPGKLHKYADNGDYQTYIERIREFIRVGFNRQIDRDNEVCKVKLESAPNLFGFIICRTIAEYCKVKLESWNKYRPDNIDRIMSGNPSTRPERQLKKTVTRAYKHNAWALRHDSKLLKDADQWYKCRVNPGSIEAYLDELANDYKYPERSNIEIALAPYDEATGYPRKWRK